MEVKVFINELCQLVAVQEDYIEGVTYIEFIKSDHIDVADTDRISEGSEVYVLDLPEDGSYTYYRFQDSELLYIDGMLKSFDDILKIKDQLDYFEYTVFSLCKMQNCLIELQKESICNCSDLKCNQSSEESKMINFLFISLYVLENLIYRKKFYDAESILKSLSTCIPICNNVTQNNCNCNGRSI